MADCENEKCKEKLDELQKENERLKKIVKSYKHGSAYNCRICSDVSIKFLYVISGTNIFRDLVLRVML